MTTIDTLLHEYIQTTTRSPFGKQVLCYPSDKEWSERSVEVEAALLDRL